MQYPIQNPVVPPVYRDFPRPQPPTGPVVPPVYRDFPVCVTPDHTLPKKGGVVQGRLTSLGDPGSNGRILDVRDWVRDSNGNLHALVGDQLLSMPACGTPCESTQDDPCVCPLDHYYDGILDYCFPDATKHPPRKPTEEPEHPPRKPTDPSTAGCCFRIGVDPDTATLHCPSLPAYHGMEVEVYETFEYPQGSPFEGNTGVRVRIVRGDAEHFYDLPLCEDDDQPPPPHVPPPPGPPDDVPPPPDTPPPTIPPPPPPGPPDDVPPPPDTPPPRVPPPPPRPPTPPDDVPPPPPRVPPPPTPPDEEPPTPPDAPPPRVPPPPPEPPQPPPPPVDIPEPDPDCPPGHYRSETGECVPDDLEPPTPPPEVPPGTPVPGCCYDARTKQLCCPSSRWNGLCVPILGHHDLPDGRKAVVFQFYGERYSAEICPDHGSCCDACAIGAPCGGGCGCGREHNPRRSPAQARMRRGCARIYIHQDAPHGTKRIRIHTRTNSAIVCARKGYVLSIKRRRNAVASFHDVYGRLIYVLAIGERNMRVSQLRRKNPMKKRTRQALGIGSGAALGAAAGGPAGALIGGIGGAYVGRKL